MKRVATLLAMACLSAAANAGQVYKWVDKSGHFHFSDTPQPGWTRIDAGRANALTAEVPRVGDDPGSEAQAAECQKRRDTLASYRNAARIVERDALGNEKEYGPEQKQALVARAEQQVAEACGENATPP
ncbi:DUF4124 domain-containing protein [Solimonas soli]|uniref:DUF4124 domain-containing protein n=1 Tax=Solimonas soli TaxID=413479 RepID=UPI0004855EE5|nr:DUF4124 domain-containing protein [Solimonas soli]